jgi:hypothetical protein
MTEFNVVPEEFIKRTVTWHKLFYRWWFIHYAIGLTGTLAAMSVAANPKFLGGWEHTIGLLSWLSALSVASLTFLDPKKRARTYVAAWRLLEAEITKYKYKETNNIQGMLDAIKEGEEMVAEMDR